MLMQNVKRSPPRHTRSDGAANAGSDGPAARLRPGEADSPGVGRRPRAESGHALSCAPATGTAPLDQVAMGRLGEQSESEVLRTDSQGAQADRGRDRKLAADGFSDGEVSCEA